MMLSAPACGAFWLEKIMRERKTMNRKTMKKTEHFSPRPRAVFSRRSFVQTLCCAAPLLAAPLFPARLFASPLFDAPIGADHGPIRPPIPVPDINLVCHNGASTTLPRLADGHATAVQLMFTHCTTSCPIGA